MLLIPFLMDFMIQKYALHRQNMQCMFFLYALCVACVYFSVKSRKKQL